MKILASLRITNFFSNIFYVTIPANNVAPKILKLQTTQEQYLISNRLTRSAIKTQFEKRLRFKRFTFEPKRIYKQKVK